MRLQVYSGKPPSEDENPEAFLGKPDPTRRKRKNNRLDKAWDPDKHPRGQPGNPGQFAHVPAIGEQLQLFTPSTKPESPFRLQGDKLQLQPQSRLNLGPHAQGSFHSYLYRYTTTAHQNVLLKGVRYDETWGPSVGQQMDAEVLTSKLGLAIGAPVGEVRQTHLTPREPSKKVPDLPNQLLETFLSGTPACDVTPIPHPSQFEDSPGARKLGLLDYLVANQDRHMGNWLVQTTSRTGEKSVAGIDHGLAFWTPPNDSPEGSTTETARPQLNDPDFVPPQGFADMYIHTRWPRGGITDTEFTSQELRDARAALKKTRPDFKKAGRLNWYESVSKRCDHLLRVAEKQERE